MWLYLYADPKPSSMAECIEQYRFPLQQAVYDLTQANDRGQLVYTPELIRACAAAIDSGACGDWDFRFTPFDDGVNTPTCLKLVEPLVDDGGACRERQDCVSGSCIEVLGSQAQEFVCDARGTLGQACDLAPPYQCREGLYCANGTCAPKQAGGAPCLAPQECRSNYCVDQVCVAVCEGK
jgi:hypothetical protein